MMSIGAGTTTGGYQESVRVVGGLQRNMSAMSINGLQGSGGQAFANESAAPSVIMGGAGVGYTSVFGDVSVVCFFILVTCIEGFG